MSLPGNIGKEINVVEKRLEMALTEHDVLSLKLRDVVYLDGTIFTGSSGFHHLVAEQDILPPFDFEKMNVLLHGVPVVKENEGYKLVGLTPTSSRKLEKYNPIVVRKLKPRAIIGKTTVGPATMKAMQEVGCIHLTAVGTPSTVLTQRTKRVLSPYLQEELGPAECIWALEVENFGPFIVDVDAHGNNLFQQLEKETGNKMKELYHKYGIPEDFQYTIID